MFKNRIFSTPARAMDVSSRKIKIVIANSSMQNWKWPKKIKYPAMSFGSQNIAKKCNSS